ncbi:MAG: dephospho-CoA kinase [Betaproteobacteria bacterium]
MPNPSYIVALTGGIGSGKSTVAGLFGQHGAHVIDTDIVAHRLTASGGTAIEPIARKFGDGMIAATGALDRSRMRDQVFADGSARAALEQILHPMIRAEVGQELGSDAARRAPYVMLAVPLLFETMVFRKQADRALVVDCPTALQRRRVQQRSGLSPVEVERILASQISRDRRLQLADDVISNSDALAALPAQVKFLHGRYGLLART